MLERCLTKNSSIGSLKLKNQEREVIVHGQTIFSLICYSIPYFHSNQVLSKE